MLQYLKQRPCCDSLSLYSTTGIKTHKAMIEIVVLLHGFMTKGLNNWFCGDKSIIKKTKVTFTDK